MNGTIVTAALALRHAGDAASTEVVKGRACDSTEIAAPREVLLRDLFGRGEA
jgi:hypothetical protein